MVRRTVNRDGRSRASINDQPVGVALLRRAGSDAGGGAGPGRADGPGRSRQPCGPAGRLSGSTRRSVKDAVRGPGTALQNAQRPAARRTGTRSRRPGARRTGCATPPTELQALAPGGGGGGPASPRNASACNRASGARKPIAAALVGDGAARPPQRRPGGGAAQRRPRAATADAAPGQDGDGNPAAPAMAALGAGRGGAGRGGNPAEPARQRGRVRPAAAGTGRGAAVRPARRRPQVHGVPSTELPGAARPSFQAHGCRRWTPAPPPSPPGSGGSARPAADLRGGGGRPQPGPARRGQAARGRRHDRNCRRCGSTAPASWWTCSRWSPRRAGTANGADQVRFLIATNPGQSPGSAGPRSPPGGSCRASCWR